MDSDLSFSVFNMTKSACVVFSSTCRHHDSNDTFLPGLEHKLPPSG